MKTKLSLLLFTILFALMPINIYSAIPYFDLTIFAYATLYKGTLSFSVSQGGLIALLDDMKYYHIPSFSADSVQCPEWYEDRESITKIVFDSDFARYRPKSTASWFNGLSNVTDIEGLEYLNTDSVTHMGWMFYGCSSLKSVDVSHFNTSNVTVMYSMFCNCSSLNSLNVSNFNTSKVTAMGYMFGGCSSLSNLYLGNFETSKVRTMRGMFHTCSSLKSLDVSSFDTSNVTNMNCMFYRCGALTNLVLGDFDTSSVENMGHMFNGCGSLTTLDVSGFVTKKVTDMGLMFCDCSKLSTLELPGFDVTKVTTTKGMFWDCTSLKTIYANSNWNTAANTESTYMFTGCTSLVGGKGTKFNSNYTDKTYARPDGGTSSPGYFTTKVYRDFDYTGGIVAYCVLKNGTLTFYYDDAVQRRTGDKYQILERYSYSSLPKWQDDQSKIKKVVFDVSFASYRPTSTSHWFYECANITEIVGLENLITEEVTDMSYMFQKCTSLTSLSLEDFDTSNVKSMSYMFGSCQSLTSLSISCFNTSKVTSMVGMFSKCSSLQSVDLSGFETSSVTNMTLMFNECSKLTTLNLSSFDMTNVTQTPSMFWGCSSLKTIYANINWKSSTNENSQYMFYGCKNLVGGKGTKYNSNKTDINYAHPDGGTSSPGYFTSKSDGDLTTTSSTIAYAVFSGSTLTFYYDNKSSSRSGAKYAIKNSYTVNGTKPGWYEKRKNIKKAVIDESFAGYIPTSTACWFYDCNNLLSIEGMEHLNTSSVTNMEGMFRFCYVLTAIDLSHFDTRNVTNMSCMFCFCRSLTNIDVSTFNTEKVTNMEHMFHTCPVEILDLSMFDTHNVSKTDLMFADCGKVKTIYGKRALWSNAKMSASNSISMFRSCNVLVGGMGTKFTSKHINYEYAIIDDGPTVNPGYLTDPLPAEKEAYAVYKDNVLTFYYDNLIRTRTGNIYRYNAGEFRSKSDDGWAKHFNDALVKTVVFDPSFGDFHELTTTKYWFGHKDKSILTEFRGMQYLNTENVIDMSNMFLGCRALTSVDVSHFDTGNVMTMLGMFCYCTKIKSLDLTSFDTAKCLDMSFMFGECSSMTSVDVSSFDTGRVTTMEKMFYYCSSLPKLDITMFDTHSCKNMVGMFKSCYNLTTLDVSSFDTHNVEKMDDGTYGGMFEYCNKVTTIYVGDGWSTAGLTSHSDMLFKECTSLVGGLGTRYDPAHTDYTYAHVDGGRSNPGYLTYKDSSCDVNDDGKVDVADIATVIDVMAGKSDTATEKAADVNNDGKVDVADIATIIDVMAGGEVSGGGNETVPDNAPKDVVAVDLGLPSGTKWANMNVGATKVEDYGQFFAWGETTGYSSVNTSDGRSFNWNSYKWCSSTDTKMTKYCTNSAYGTVDNITVLDTADDAARANWGGQWVMPTKEEMQELFDGTISEWTTQNGVNGRRFTSRMNGSSIFLPAAGMRYNAILNGQGASGCYWSASLMLSGSYHAHYLDFNSGAISISNVYRSFGYSVRPVIRK